LIAFQRGRCLYGPTDGLEARAGAPASWGVTERRLGALIPCERKNGAGRKRRSVRAGTAFLRHAFLKKGSERGSCPFTSRRVVMGGVGREKTSGGGEGPWRRLARAAGRTYYRRGKGKRRYGPSTPETLAGKRKRPAATSGANAIVGSRTPLHTALTPDFRLEWDGVMKFWAVPKGPSLEPSGESGAMKTEDQSRMEYNKFEA